MKIPSWIYLFLFTVLLALGCSTIGRLVAPFMNDTAPARMLITFVVFIPLMRVLYQWHRVVLEKQNAR